MNQFEKYPAYKDSGVEWLGEIPEGWVAKKLKFLGSVFAGITNKKGDDFSKEFQKGMKPFVPFTNICHNNVISDAEYQYVRIEDFECQNLVKTNDLLFLMSSETLEDIAKCSIYLKENIELYLNSFCKGFRISSLLAFAKYINYLLNSSTYRRYFMLVGRGFTRINIKQEFINDVVAILPPLPEQTSIVTFLDEKTSKIDKAISQKEQMISLLKERKQILIQNAVTKGIDPAAKMKDSGVEWIGEIPVGWEVKRGKLLFNEVDERSVTGQEELLSVSHMTGVTPRSEKNVSMFMAEDYTGSKTCIAGDLIYNIMWAWMGALGVSDQAGIVSSSYGVYRRKDNHTLNTNFIEFLLKSKAYVAYYNKVSTGLHSSRLRFYSHMFFNMKIAFPPLSEQEYIIQHIENQSAKIDISIALQLKQIAKLKEYKSTLIDSAVTGKIKVC